MVRQIKVGQWFTVTHKKKDYISVVSNNGIVAAKAESIIFVRPND